MIVKLPLTDVPVVILPIAALLDFLLADPVGWLHPVQVMGWVIGRISEQVLTHCKASLVQRVAGVGLGLLLIGGSGFVGWCLVALSYQIHMGVGIAVESLLLASCFAARSLRNAAIAVLHPLSLGDVAGARTVLSRYVGRDTENLSEPDILRAVLETVSENAVDGVMAPLFYAIAGALIPGIGSVPLALAYKAASTLDSMVGYKEPPYTYLGWFSARLEDALTWLPCRLTVFTLALLSGKPRQVWHICRRDGPKDPSPNSGWSECAYAATLGVQMGGTNWYRGVAKPKPFLGDATVPITVPIIQTAIQLTRWCFLLWLTGAVLLILAIDAVV